MVLHNGTDVASTDTNGNEPSQVTVPSWINGVEETGPSTFDVISPYTNTICWTSTSVTPADALRAVDAASAAFPAWSATKPTARRDILLRAADLLEERTEANAEIMRTEMGADVGASQFFVVPLAIKMLRDVAGRITSVCGSVPTVEEEGQSAIVYKEPMGVILGIVPWLEPLLRPRLTLPQHRCSLSTQMLTALSPGTRPTSLASALPPPPSLVATPQS